MKQLFFYSSVFIVSFFSCTYGMQQQKKQENFSQETISSLCDHPIIRSMERVRNKRSNRGAVRSSVEKIHRRNYSRYNFDSFSSIPLEVAVGDFSSHHVIADDKFTMIIYALIGVVAVSIVVVGCYVWFIEVAEYDRYSSYYSRGKTL